MSNPSLNELKQIAKMIRIKNYKNISKEDLLSALDELDYYTENNSNNARTKKIRHRFLRPKIKEIRENLYEIENTRNLSKKKKKKIDQNLTELIESLFKLNKYYDDLEYKGIRHIKDLYDEIDEGYYKPIKASNSNYIEYESNGDKDKNLSQKNILTWSDHI